MSARRVLVVLLLAASCLAQSYNPCETSGSCCFSLNFGATPGIEGGEVAQGFEIAPTAASPWGAGSLGVKFGVDSSMVRTGTTNWLYSVAVLNTSSVVATMDWRELRHAGPVAVVAAALSPQLSVFRGSTVLWANFTAGRPACLKSISLIRSFAIAYRMGVTITLYAPSGAVIDSGSYPWSLQVENIWLNTTYSVSNVGAIRISFTGVGYGAFSSLSACYASTAFDQCGVCGGNGSRCTLPPAGPQVGDVCFNASMSNPVCRPGVYSSALQCVPDLFNVTQETCNGVDDDCDGVIDNDATAINVSCGVGECARVVWACANGTGHNNLTCAPGQPEPEICNGLDDDCDGVVDNGHVCDRPVEGVAIVPIARCIEGRSSPTATACYAHFGFWNSDPVFNVTRPYNTSMNAVDTVPADSTSTAGADFVVPTFFAANSSSSDAFRVPVQCKNGAAIWTLGDGQDHYLEAVVYADSSPPCESYVGGSEALSTPITVFVESACVARTAGQCSVAFGYYNPNTGAPAYFIPTGTLQNTFYIDSGTTSSAAINAQVSSPAIFYQDRVRGAALVNWPCPTGSEDLRWHLQTAGVTHEAIALASNTCP